MENERVQIFQFHDSFLEAVSIACDNQMGEDFSVVGIGLVVVLLNRETRRPTRLVVGSKTARILRGVRWKKQREQVWQRIQTALAFAQSKIKMDYGVGEVQSFGTDVELDLTPLYDEPEDGGKGGG